MSLSRLVSLILSHLFISQMQAATSIMFLSAGGVSSLQPATPLLPQPATASAFHPVSATAPASTWWWWRPLPSNWCLPPSPPAHIRRAALPSTSPSRRSKYYLERRALNRAIYIAPTTNNLKIPNCKRVDELQTSQASNS